MKLFNQARDSLLESLVKNILQGSDSFSIKIGLIKSAYFILNV